MRQISILILVVIGTSLFAAGLPFPSFGYAGTVSIQTLDVCHSATPVANPDLPYISGCPCAPMPVLVTVILELPHTTLNPLVLVFKDERPPKV